MHLNSIRPCHVGSLLVKGEPCAPARLTEGTERSSDSTVGRGGVVGAGTLGRVGGITLRAAAPGVSRKGHRGSSQSAHSSGEAGNDRGAKGRREVKR